MNKEMSIKNGILDFTVFLQSGFFETSKMTANYHRHNYTEIHTVTDEAVFIIGDEEIALKGGDVIAIPKKILHRCIQIADSTLHTAFQATIDIERPLLFTFPKEAVIDFINRIEEARKNDTYNIVSSYINLLTTPFINSHTAEIKNIDDYAFLITEFFSHGYSDDITLGNLADLLHVSERHAERLVKEITGNPFNKELTRIRTKTAEHLIKKTDLPLSEIAKQVGYKSYAGFYKAMKKNI